MKPVQTSIVLFSLSIITSILSFVKEAVFANYFGITSQADAYAIAIQIPVVLFSVISVAVKTSVIPLYSEQYYRKGKEDADKFALNLLTIAFILTTCFTLAAIFNADLLIYLFAPGFNSETHNLSVSLLRISLPAIIFSTLTDINTGLMNVHRSIILPSLTVNIQNILFIIILLIFSKVYGIYAAIVGILLGAVAQYLYSLSLIRKKIKYVPQLNIRDPLLKRIGSMTIPVFIGIGAAEINVVISKAIVSFLNEGSIASLSYASRLSGAFSGLLISSISVVVYPLFAEKAAKKEMNSLRQLFTMTLSIYILISIPIIYGAWFLRYEIVALAFGRGAFNELALSRTSILFSIYIMSMLSLAIRDASSKLFYAFSETKKPMINSIYGIGINIVLSIVLSKLIGANGIALASTISTILISIILIKNTTKLINGLEYKKLSLLTINTFISTVIMAIVLFFLKPYINSFGILLATIVLIIVGAFVYFFMLRVLGVKEVEEVISMFRLRSAKEK